MGSGVIWLAAIVLVGLAFRAGLRGKRTGTMTGAVAGTMYDWMNEDKQKAVEIIVDGKAEATDPETADGRPRAGRSRRAGRSGRVSRSGRHAAFPASAASSSRIRRFPRA